MPLLIWSYHFFQVDAYCRENNLLVGGYYQANEHAEDIKLVFN